MLVNFTGKVVVEEDMHPTNQPPCGGGGPRKGYVTEVVRLSCVVGFMRNHIPA